MIKKSKNKFDRESILTFADAFLYEPAVMSGEEDIIDSYKYVFKKPDSLPKYLNYFALPDGSIDEREGAEMFRCVGIHEINAPHDVL